MLRTGTIWCAAPPPRRRRVARFLLSTPRRVELYFANRPGRRWSWRFISVGLGYLCGNTVSLTFGTLAVNDIVAAVVTVLFYVAVSQLYWGAERKTYRLELLNLFKNGVVVALIADSFKLGDIVLADLRAPRPSLWSYCGSYTRLRSRQFLVYATRRFATQRQIIEGVPRINPPKKKKHFAHDHPSSRKYDTNNHGQWSIPDPKCACT